MIGNNQFIKIFIAFSILTVSMTVHSVCLNCSCTVTSSALAFGNYNPFLATPITNQATVNVSCVASNSSDASVVLTLDTGRSGNYTQRTMKNETNNSLNYNLYTSNGYTTIWGNGSNRTGIVSLPDPPVKLRPGGIMNVGFIIYGRIPGSQTSVVAGNYSDTIIATLYY